MPHPILPLIISSGGRFEIGQFAGRNYARMVADKIQLTADAGQKVRPFIIVHLLAGLHPAASGIGSSGHSDDEPPVQFRVVII